MNQNHLYVIAYDTPDNKRRRKFVKLLVGHGIRKQKSVFELDVSDTQLKWLWGQLVAIAEPLHDQLNAYRCCSYCRDAIMQSGPDVESAEAPQVWLM